ncbi:DUF1080 domain-containing protein [candidate division KSB1 bacterium]|nr:DUF1080 domain-containing protein [candidate division KSB1 bacterium]RQW07935.1 MAG: DUF1080 domain-containing protein [candidate division KSB1 bacterium]
MTSLFRTAAIIFLFAPLTFAGDWIDLFDGHSLDGWSVHSGYATFHVREGAIVGTTATGSPNTFLCTEKTYGDFILEFEVKCDPRLNSGVQFRSIIPRDDIAFIFQDRDGKLSAQKHPKDRVYGYQVEITTAENGASGGVYDEARRAYFLQDIRGQADASRFRDGEWNKYRIQCQGNHIQTWVNDVPCSDFQDDMTYEGVIGLQVHSIGDRQDVYQVMWRNIRIQEMD